MFYAKYFSNWYIPIVTWFWRFLKFLKSKPCHRIGKSLNVNVLQHKLVKMTSNLGQKWPFLFVNNEHYFWSSGVWEFLVRVFRMMDEIASYLSGKFMLNINFQRLTIVCCKRKSVPLLRIYLVFYFYLFYNWNVMNVWMCKYRYLMIENMTGCCLR